MGEEKKKPRCCRGVAAVIIAVAKMMISWKTCEYKTDFDEVFLNGNYELIAHDVITINHTHPTIAVSSLFSMDDYNLKDDVLRVVVNVVPLSKNQTFIIFSYRYQEADIARTALDRILNATGEDQLLEISRLILNNCENFVLSPKYVKTWEASKKETIRNYYISTVIKNDMEFQSPDLYLF